MNFPRFSVLCAVLASVPAAAPADAPVAPAAPAAPPSETPAYAPHPVDFPKAASYLLPDGSIQIVGNDGLEEMVKEWDTLFVKTHPGFTFTANMKGSSVGLGGLTAGVSALGPMGREGWPIELAGFKEAIGYPPLDIHIGYDDYTRPKHKSPPGIYVSAKNPIEGLTVDQVERIFTSGNRKGDITRWSQLGLKGRWAEREIHLYGVRDDGTAATSARLNLMHRLPFSARYEPLAKNTDIVRAVKEDVYGIGLVSFFDSGSEPGAKLVPLAAKEGAPFVAPSYENVHGGLYPYSPNIRIYVNRAPGKPLDAFVKEYLRLVLSREGQAVIESLKDGEDGYVPLDPAAIPAELAKLD
jgi:phosphate transport system substrate-binding protein